MTYMKLSCWQQGDAGQWNHVNGTGWGCINQSIMLMNELHKPILLQDKLNYIFKKENSFSVQNSWMLA